jgi:hypothetical protein
LPGRVGKEWVAWLVEVFQAALCACKGFVACGCEGRTDTFRWSAVPARLMTALDDAGVCLRCTPFRNGCHLLGGNG